MIALVKSDNLIAFPQPQSKSNEWFTPARYVNAAREVMGGIDLDPASCWEANQIVRAKRYFTEHDNGLAQEWYGNVWLNPPYGRVNPELKGSTKSIQVYFMHRLLSDYERGNVKQAVALVFGTSYAMPWFQRFVSYPVCIISHRINFIKPDGTEDHFGYGNLCVYLGSNFEKFVEVFSKFGRIAKAIDTPKVQPINLSLWEVQHA